MADEVVAAAVIPSAPVVDPAAVLVPTGTIDPTPAVAPAPTPTSALEERIAELTAKVNAVLEAKAAAGAPVAAPISTEPVVDNRPGAAVRSWLAAKRAVVKSWSFLGCLNRFVSGARTLIVFAITGAIGLADSFNGIDLSGLAEQYLGTKVKVGDLITLLAVAGILLRMVTKTPVFTRWQKSASAGNDGEAAGVGSGSVDEPA